ncbi:MAG TPA: alcohol dehydrogenase catalytic domain-containing protein [Caulobacteraceae bacterium]|nr:alcohol dehydrogenase catalytic domain-containing protein [Caulobacteraceae bacterium]
MKGLPTEARAIVGDGAGGFADATLTLGDPGPGEVLVAIRASGVCHTDLDSLSWGRPLILGHEGAGVVEAVGDGVSHVAAGDRVLLNWAIPCGMCVQCRRGAEALCEAKPSVPRERFGWSGGRIWPSFGLGSMASHAIVAKPAVVKIEVDVPFTSAAILGCGVMTGFGSVVNAAKVEPGSSVVVLGCGGVGLSCVQGAAYAGAGMVIAVDVKAERLALAQAFGATHTHLASRDDAGLLAAAKAVKALIGRGADYAFECTAVPELGAAPLAMVANGGTAVAVSGIEQVVAIDMQLFEFDKLYINPLYGQCRPFSDFPRLLDLYARGRLKLDEMVTATFPLTAAGLRQAFAAMRAGEGAKTVLVP